MSAVAIEVNDVFKAVREGRVEDVKSAIAEGFNLDTRNSDGNALLHVALFNCQSEIVKLLIEIGADVRAPGADGMPPICCAFKSAAAMALMLETEARLDVNAGDSAHGFTALQNATNIVKSGFFCSVDLTLVPERIAVMRLLLAAGAKVDRRNGFGRTALMSAASTGCFDMVAMLMKEGASPALVCYDGKTAIDYAIGQGKPDIIALLKGELPVDINDYPIEERAKYRFEQLYRSQCERLIKEIEGDPATQELLKSLYLGDLSLEEYLEKNPAPDLPHFFASEIDVNSFLAIRFDRELFDLSDSLGGIRVKISLYNEGRPWRPEHLDKLKRLIGREEQICCFCMYLRRSAQEIIDKLCELDLIISTQNGYIPKPKIAWLLNEEAELWVPKEEPEGKYFDLARA